MRRIDKSRKNNKKKINCKTRIMRVMRGGAIVFGPIKKIGRGFPYSIKSRYFKIDLDLPDDPVLLYYPRNPDDYTNTPAISYVELDNDTYKTYDNINNQNEYRLYINKSNENLLTLIASSDIEKARLKHLFDNLPVGETQPKKQTRSWWPWSPPPGDPSGDPDTSGDRDDFGSSKRYEMPGESTRKACAAGMACKLRPVFEPEDPYKFLKEVLRLPHDTTYDTVATKIKEQFYKTRSIKEWNTLADNLKLTELNNDVLKVINQNHTHEFLKLREKVEIHLEKEKSKVNSNLGVEEAQNLDKPDRMNIVKNINHAGQQDERSNSSWEKIKIDLREKIEELINLVNERENAKKPAKPRDTRTPYDILGVRPSATPAEIRDAYRRLALVVHPDKYATKSKEDKAAAEEEFKKVQNAYNELKIGGGKRKSHKKRKTYRKHRTRKHRKPKSHKKRKSRSHQKRMRRSTHKTRK